MKEKDERAEKIAKRICKKFDIDFLNLESNGFGRWVRFYARTRYGDKEFWFTDKEQEEIYKK